MNHSKSTKARIASSEVSGSTGTTTFPWMFKAYSFDEAMDILYIPTSVAKKVETISQRENKINSTYVLLGGEIHQCF